MLHVPASRLRLRSVALLLLAGVCFLAAGCGSGSSSGNLLSRQQASALRASLTQVEQDVAAKNCTGAAERVSALQQQIDSIKRLDGNLRSSLTSSVRRLETLVNNACQTTAAAPTQTTPSTGDTGASGASGTTGADGKKPKKPKKEKAPKTGTTGPGQGDQNQPGPQNGGGGAGVPGESNNSNGNGN